jgi:hypothetical protein
MKLFINLAACFGVFGTTMLRPDFGPAPFRGLIGPRRKLDEQEVLASCRAFYRTIFDQKDGNAALKAMNDAMARRKRCSGPCRQNSRSQWRSKTICSAAKDRRTALLSARRHSRHAAQLKSRRSVALRFLTRKSLSGTNGRVLSCSITKLASILSGGSSSTSTNVRRTRSVSISRLRIAKRQATLHLTGYRRYGDVPD